MDLSRGYWQVPVGAASWDKTAFVTPQGLFQFRVMPFGLHDAAAYLDDLVIYSSTWEEHLTQLRAALNSLHSAGLTVKPSKCQFGMSRRTYLGHVVGGDHVCPDHSKIRCVESFATPTEKKQVRRFLGLTGYYRKFIPDYWSGCSAQPV